MIFLNSVFVFTSFLCHCEMSFGKSAKMKIKANKTLMLQKLPMSELNVTTDLSSNSTEFFFSNETHELNLKTEVSLLPLLNTTDVQIEKHNDSNVFNGSASNSDSLLYQSQLLMPNFTDVTISAQLDLMFTNSSSTVTPVSLSRTVKKTLAPPELGGARTTTPMLPLTGDEFVLRRESTKPMPAGITFVIALTVIGCLAIAVYTGLTCVQRRRQLKATRNPTINNPLAANSMETSFENPAYNVSGPDQS